MMQYWQRIVLRVDALSLRERAIVFALATLVLITLVNELLLDPEFVKQKRLSQQVKQDQTRIAVIQSQIQQKARSQTADPDADNRELLKKLNLQSKQMHGELNELQKGLVSPDKMAELLENILKRNAKLRLVSLKSLPPTGLNEAIQADTKNNGDKATAAAIQINKEKIDDTTVVTAAYKHGVEVVVQGNYLDMITYMTELEAMPWQLFWGRAKLEAAEYPKATLTLTLYTLSLDKKWLNI